MRELLRTHDLKAFRKRHPQTMWWLAVSVLVIAGIASVYKLNEDSISRNCHSINEIKRTLVVQARRERDKGLKQLADIEAHTNGPVIKGISNAALEKNQRQQFRRTQIALAPNEC